MKRLKKSKYFFLPKVFLFMKVCGFCTVLGRTIHANK